MDHEEHPMTTAADRIATLRQEIAERLAELEGLIGPERARELVQVKHVVARECSRAFNEETKKSTP